MIPFAYSHRNLRVRWKTTLMTASGFTLVVAALIVMLAFIQGMQTVCAVTGQPENVLVLNRGNSDEVLSQIDHHTVAQVQDSAGVLRDSSGRIMASSELYCAINERQADTGDLKMVQARGVRPMALEVHSHIKLIEGRLFVPGRNEAIVGRAVQANRGLKLGESISVGPTTRRIVGVFDAAGSIFESEIWVDLAELQQDVHRVGTVSTIVLRTDSPQSAAAIARTLSASRQISVDAQTEPDYYEKQSQQVKMLFTAGLTIAVFMGIGAIFGVTNTMYAAIGQRTKDIAVMRLMGFRKHEILVSFLCEALLIAAFGGLLGSAIGYSINGFSVNSILSAKAVALAFNVTPESLLGGILFSMVMGVIGGSLPAVTAMRIDPLQSLR